jgi:hypothetical protein
LINGSDPQLAASASGILLANSFIGRDQHAAALVYAWAHAIVYGRPWRQACPLGDKTGWKERGPCGRPSGAALRRDQSRWFCIISWAWLLASRTPLSWSFGIAAMMCAASCTIR